MIEQFNFGRLDENIKYYKQSADRNLRTFYTFKMLQILTGASIPICSLVIPIVSADGYRLAAIINGILGSLIAGTEGYLQLRQTERNWHRWRSTEQALQRERSLFVQEAGPYYSGTGPKPPNIRLAERVEQIISEEHLEWRAGLQQTTQVDGKQKESNAETDRQEGPNIFPPTGHAD